MTFARKLIKYRIPIQTPNRRYFHAFSNNGGNNNNNNILFLILTTAYILYNKNNGPTPPTITNI